MEDVKQLENILANNKQETVGHVKIVNHSDGHLFGVVFTQEIEELIAKEENEDCKELLTQGVQMLHSAIFTIFQRDGRLITPDEEVAEESIEE